MHFLRLPSKCGGCGLPFWQRPRASSARLPFATRRSAGRFSPAIRKWQGWTRPQPSRWLAPRQSGSSARLLPGRPRGIGKVRGDRLPSQVRPHRCTISDMAHGALVRCISPLAAIRSRRGTSGRGVPRPGRVSPTDAGLLQRARLPGLPGFPGKCRIATATPNCFDAPRLPWTSGWPRRCRQRTAPTWDSLYTHHQRITTAACVAALAAKGSAPRSAPRHYRNPALADGARFARMWATDVSGAVVTGVPGP